MSKASYKCVIVDDESLGRELIATHLAQFDQFELVASCASAIEASGILNEQAVDLMFLDIEMPVLKGTEFFRNLSSPPKVIFTTAYRDYAVEGFDLEAVDYLLKPIIFSRFFQAIERFLLAQRNSHKDFGQELNREGFLYVRENRKDVKLLLDDIHYVRSMRDYLEIHTERRRCIIKGRISEFAERLGADFVRIHRSYIVSRAKVTAVTRHDVEIGEVELPIGERFRREVLKRLGIDGQGL